MITSQMYASHLSTYGNNLSEIKRTQSDMIINNTFKVDKTYRHIYILSKDGWKFEDVKFQVHTTPSILKDAVDYYLQFRPKTFYPIGTYVFIPDDSGYEINISGEYLNNPFSLPDDKITQLWMIVGTDESGGYIRYNVLKCNWNFRWVFNGDIYNCWGCVRNANSYTSGWWRDEISSSLDNLTSAWIPDIYYTYGENLCKYGLFDNRTITYEQRFMLTNNRIDPKVYKVSKIVDLVPQGIIKLTIKQDTINNKRDNFDLMICDYYTDSGEINVEYERNQFDQNDTQIEINSMIVNNSNELEPIANVDKYLYIGKLSYFRYMSYNKDIDLKWKIEVIDFDNNYTDEEKEYIKGLIKITSIDNTIVSLKPGKAKSLVGKKILLSVTDEDGNNYSSIELEVTE